jgi:flagellar motor switch protein FliN/FliY
MSDTEPKVPLPDLETGGQVPAADAGTLAPEAGDPSTRGAEDLEAVFDVPVHVSAVLGRTRMDIGDLLRLGPGTVLELDRKVGESIDIFVNNRLVARGEVVLVEERLGVTMTEIIKADRN